MKVSRAADPSLLFSPPSSEREVHRTAVLPLSRAELEATEVRMIAPSPKKQHAQDAGEEEVEHPAAVMEANAVGQAAASAADAAAAAAAAEASLASFVPAHSVRWADADQGRSGEAPESSAVGDSSSSSSNSLHASPSSSRLSSASSMRAQLQGGGSPADADLASFARPSALGNPSAAKLF
jgi:hypothetical protein